jgi:hypothetical protein
LESADAISLKIASRFLTATFLKRQSLADYLSEMLMVCAIVPWSGSTRPFFDGQPV